MARYNNSNNRLKGKKQRHVLYYTAVGEINTSMSKVLYDGDDLIIITWHGHQNMYHRMYVNGTSDLSNLSEMRRDGATKK